MPYILFKMQRPDPVAAAKRKAVTAACTEELRKVLGRAPAHNEVLQAVEDHYQAEYRAYREAKAERKANRKAAKAAQRHI